MSQLTIQTISRHLVDCGYRVMHKDFPVSDGLQVPLVAFAHNPPDARTACIAVVQSDAPSVDIAAIRPLCAPLVIVCRSAGIELWQQTIDEPIVAFPPVPSASLEGFFKANRERLTPSRVYAAKTWGRFDKQFQLSFVDRGLMPMVEAQIGERLQALITRGFETLRQRLGMGLDFSKADGDWLLESIFWLVSAKILGDKDVSAFAGVDIADVESTFKALGIHYGTNPPPIRTKKEASALARVAEELSRFSSLHLTTTEALAHVYENTLVSKQVRKALGTHSTPPFLVDYVLAKLRPWIEDIPFRERRAFEPACGHAAFLVSAMRLLTELHPEELTPAARRAYLRPRIRGIEIDQFALEVARLSLTLTDVPNPNGWGLIPADMFKGDALERESKNATIFLANAPFERFTPEERETYEREGVELTQRTKTSEMLARVLPCLPQQAVIGVVVPAGFLNSSEAVPLRKQLAADFELAEICLFADKVFSFASTESAILVGRKNAPRGGTLKYARVREREFQQFRSTFEPTSQRKINQSRFQTDPSANMLVPDLEQVWEGCRRMGMSQLASIADVGQGLIYRGTLPPGAVTISPRKFPGAIHGFDKFPKGVRIHQLPPEVWLSVDREHVRRPLHGTTVDVPQLVFNEAPTDRGPWRIKALIDTTGHGVTGRFNVVRPLRGNPIPLEALWAIFNSPIANAFAFAHMRKRHNDAGVLRAMPIPALSKPAVRTLLQRVAGYLTYVEEPREGLRSPINADRARELWLRVEAEVFELYALPAEAEHQILAAFTEYKREGFPFSFEGYFPPTFRGPIKLRELLAITADWKATNHRRADLIEKELEDSITDAEKVDLEELQRLASLRKRLIAPLPLEEVRQLRKEIALG